MDRRRVISSVIPLTGGVDERASEEEGRGRASRALGTEGGGGTFIEMGKQEEASLEGESGPCVGCICLGRCLVSSWMPGSGAQD